MDYSQSKNLNIAVIGSGISGITTAYLLQNTHNVTLYEKNNYFGGHTNTITIPDGPDEGLPVDTGFIVLNKRTYPHFIRLLNKLGVEKCRTDMSFSYYSKTSGLHYASSGINALFAQRKNIFKPVYLRFVFEMIRYLKTLRKEYLDQTLPDINLSEYVNKKGLHQQVVDWFIIPMAAAIWSGSEFQMGQFPIRTFAQFYENHGLLGVTGHPPWYFVKGGSHSYVKAFLHSFKGKAIKGSHIESISRSDNNVILHFKDQSTQVFDAVVLATHADQAMALLERPSKQEKKLLGAWSYSHNQTFLHTDSRFMPPNKRAWASWNYTQYDDSDINSPVTVSYDMTRLQRLDTQQSYFVTLNPQTPVPEEYVIKEIDYTHPQYSFEAFGSQDRLPSLNGQQKTFFCGAYFGYGFHEDGVKSGLEVAKKFGVTL